MARTDRPGEAYGGGSGRGAAEGMSTGKAKFLEQESKAYNEPVKGSGKPSYQNVTKPNRINTKERAVDITTHVKENLVGKTVSNQEKRAIGNRAENVAKQIDREYKEQKGVRTAPPTTPKVPVKPKGTQANHAVTDHSNNTRIVNLGTNPTN